MKVNRNKLMLTFTGIVIVSGVLYGLNTKKFQNNLEPKDFITWVNNEENGLVKINTIENYTYRCQYLPTEYFMAKYPNLNYSENQKMDFQKTVSLVFEFIPKKIDDAILSPDIIGHEKYSDRLYYLNSIAKYDFKLVSSGDTLKCTSLNYENPFSLSKNLKVLLEFENQSATIMDDFTLIYEDNLLGGGIIKFQFEESSLKSVPKLKSI